VSSHFSRLDDDLMDLLHCRPVAALACLDEQGAPAVSMVSYAIDPATADLLVHVSALAAHTRQMAADGRVGLMVLGADGEAQSPQALPRVSLGAQARFVEPGGEEAAHCQAVYLARHPQAELMTQLPDFRFVRLRVQSVRQVQGFGAARSVEAARWRELFTRAAGAS
jgi:putative heme iron utilization protein